MKKSDIPDLLAYWWYKIFASKWPTWLLFTVLFGGAYLLSK